MPTFGYGSADARRLAARKAAIDALSEYSSRQEAGELFQPVTKTSRKQDYLVHAQNAMAKIRKHLTRKKEGPMRGARFALNPWLRKLPLHLSRDDLGASLASIIVYMVSGDILALLGDHTERTLQKWIVELGPLLNSAQI